MYTPKANLLCIVISKAAVKETPSRLKAMQDTVLRMNEKNLKYQAENKSLKQDLEKLMAELGTRKAKQGVCHSSCLAISVNCAKLHD